MFALECSFIQYVFVIVSVACMLLFVCAAGMQQDERRGVDTIDMKVSIHRYRIYNRHLYILSGIYKCLFCIHNHVQVAVVGTGMASSNVKTKDHVLKYIWHTQMILVAASSFFLPLPVLPAYLPVCLPALFVCLSACLLARSFACPSFLPSFLPACLPAFLSPAFLTALLLPTHFLCALTTSLLPNLQSDTFPVRSSSFPPNTHSHSTYINHSQSPWLFFSFVCGVLCLPPRSCQFRAPPPVSASCPPSCIHTRGGNTCVCHMQILCAVSLSYVLIQFCITIARRPHAYSFAYTDPLNTVTVSFTYASLICFCISQYCVCHCLTCLCLGVSLWHAWDRACLMLLRHLPILWCHCLTCLCAGVSLWHAWDWACLLLLRHFPILWVSLSHLLMSWCITMTCLRLSLSHVT